MSKPRLPRWIEECLARWIDPSLYDGIYGDLLEAYLQRRSTHGRWRAHGTLIWNVLGFIRYRKLLGSKGTDYSLLISLDMILNHLVVSTRNLLKHRIDTFFNTVGLTISFASCLLIGLYVQHEFSYDRYHENGDRLYRLASQVEGRNYEQGIAKVSAPWGPEASLSIPEVESSCRFVFYGRPLVARNDQISYESGGLWADSTVFDLFTWPFVYGDPSKAMSTVNSLVLTRRLADKYFPGTDPVGQSLTFNQTVEMRITGVIEDLPPESHFTFSFLVPIHGYEPPDQGDIWTTWNQYYTYLLLAKDADPALVTSKIDEMLTHHMDEEKAATYAPLLQPIQEIHLHSKLHREMSTNSDISYVYIFSIVALLILFIASTNFVNLYTARASQRAREVGVRKIVGAHRRAIMSQFVIEALLVTLFSGAVAIVVAKIFLPTLNLALGLELALDLFGNPQLLVGLVTMVVVTGLLAGSYPATVLSSIKVIHALRSDTSSSLFRSLTSGGALALFRKGSVIFQFGIATFLIVGALVVNSQLNYIQQKNLGFNKDQIIVVPMNTQETIADAARIKDELLKIPGVEHVTASANRPGGSDYGVPYRAVGIPEDEQPAMRCLVVDEDFFDTYEIELADGRLFSKEMSRDSTVYLINETAAAQLGWENPLDHMLSMPVVQREPSPIVGVVKDFHFHSLHEPIGPLYFFMEKTWFSQFSLKLNAERIEETLAALREMWPNIEPNHPFQYSFFDQSFASLHAAEARVAEMIRWFTFLAILVTCLGLFALSAYATERRTKEVGIRKVFGASIRNIWRILVREVMVLVLFAIILATPIAWLVSRNWLDNFAYTIDFGFVHILIASSVAAAIALVTVSYHAIRSATVSPIKALHHE